MTFEANASLIILLLVAIFIVIDVVPTTVVAIIGALVCGFLGLVKLSDIFATLGTETMILLIGLAIVGSAMFKTGLARRIGRFLLKLFGKSEMGVYVSTMVVGTVLSAIVSNTAVVITMIPLVRSMCKEVNASQSRVLYPLVAACSFGSALTLIGTPSNIAGNTILANFGLPTMGFFDVAWVGVPLTIIGFIYMLTIGKKTLPQNTGYEGDAVEEMADSGPWDKKAILTAVIFSITLIIMMIQPKAMPLSAVALSGAIILIITGCISEKEAYQSIDMRTMLLFTGLMTITTAVNNSGGGKLLAGLIMKLIGSNTNPYVLTFIIGLICVILTSFISNTAATMIMGTVAISVAQSIGVNPTTMLMVVVITANACFATPVGGIAYTLVMGPGRYKFKDFVRMGLPLVLINLLLAIAIIPLVWSF